MVFHRIIIAAAMSLGLALTSLAQEKQPAKAGAAQASTVDAVIQMVKGGMSESFVIRWLQKQNQPVNPTPAEMSKLQSNKISETVIAAIMDPAPGAAANATASIKTPAGNGVPNPPAPPRGETATSSCPTVPAAIATAPGAQKRRLAVEAFDYSAVRNSITAMYNNDVNIGQGIRAILTEKMAQSKTAVLLEREKIKDVMKEQDFGAGNRVNQGTKAKIGKITGADAILMGDIVIFGRDDKQKKNGLGGVVRSVPVIGGVGGVVADSKKTDKAVVAINLRIVDAETGEVLDAEQARGESTRTSTNWGAIAGSWRGGAGANSGMTSSDFAETIIGEATMDAVSKIAAILEKQMPNVGAKTRSIEGRVANFDGCTLYLTIGGNDGVQVGDHFEIHQILSEITDPDTKEVLDKQTRKVGDLVVSTVRDKVAIGQYGGDPLSPGYVKGYSARLVIK
jgi:curli biogenesis system outer membrane secretion channel CsgG